MSALHPYGTVGFLDEGKTRQTHDGLTLNVYDRPPFRRKGGDVFRSTLLRRFYFTRPDDPVKNLTYNRWCHVDKRGRLMVDSDWLTPLKEVLGDIQNGGPIQDAMTFIRENHEIRIVPYAYEGVIFWREHPERANYVFVNAAQDLSHLL